MLKTSVTWCLVNIVLKSKEKEELTAALQMMYPSAKFGVRTLRFVLLSD